MILIWNKLRFVSLHFLFASEFFSIPSLPQPLLCVCLSLILFPLLCAFQVALVPLETVSPGKRNCQVCATSNQRQKKRPLK